MDSEEYEQGYQDGQMDIEEELFKGFRESSSVSVTLEDRLGYRVATVNIVTTDDTAFYSTLMRFAQQKWGDSAESVVDQGAQLRNPSNGVTTTTTSVARGPF